MASFNLWPNDHVKQLRDHAKNGTDPVHPFYNVNTDKATGRSRCRSCGDGIEKGSDVIYGLYSGYKSDSEERGKRKWLNSGYVHADSCKDNSNKFTKCPKCNDRMTTDQFSTHWRKHSTKEAHCGECAEDKNFHQWENEVQEHLDTGYDIPEPVWKQQDGIHVFRHDNTGLVGAVREFSDAAGWKLAYIADPKNPGDAGDKLVDGGTAATLEDAKKSVNDSFKTLMRSYFERYPEEHTKMRGNHRFSSFNLTLKTLARLSTQKPIMASFKKHAPYGIPEEKGGDSPHNDKKMESCVKKVMAEGHDKESAIKICKKSLGFTKKDSAVEKNADRDDECPYCWQALEPGTTECPRCNKKVAKDLVNNWRDVFYSNLKHDQIGWKTATVY